MTIDIGGVLLTALTLVGLMTVVDKCVTAIKSYADAQSEFTKIKAHALSERIVRLYADGRITFNELMACKKNHDWLTLCDKVDGGGENERGDKK